MTRMFRKAGHLSVMSSFRRVLPCLGPCVYGDILAELARRQYRSSRSDVDFGVLCWCWPHYCRRARVNATLEAADDRFADVIPTLRRLNGISLLILTGNSCLSTYCFEASSLSHIASSYRRIRKIPLELDRYSVVFCPSPEDTPSKALEESCAMTDPLP